MSDSDAVYSYAYNASTSTLGSTRTTFVTGMSNADHTTRTILYPRTVSGVLVISRGSGGNLDLGAAVESSGVSQVKSFPLTNVPAGGYNFASDGTVLGWGLRNDVGIVEHPTTGGIWAVENSFDSLQRDGQDVHENNPGEELNFLGYLNGTTTASQGSDFGYPYCFTAWTPSELPNNGNISVGTPFAQISANDSMCAQTTPPRLTWHAHMAPLDMKFNDSAQEAWVTFHGSWDRTDPAGYFVGTVAFGADGEPVDPPTSNTSFTPVLSNVDNSKCPGNCFRPVGMAFDRLGRLFMASDASGEIYVIMRDTAAVGTPSSTTTGSAAGASATSAAGASGTAASTPAASTTPSSAGRGKSVGAGFAVACGVMCVLVATLLA